jgi:hypothetical protein
MNVTDWCRLGCKCARCFDARAARMCVIREHRGIHAECSIGKEAWSAIVGIGRRLR